MIYNVVASEVSSDSMQSSRDETALLFLKMEMNGRACLSLQQSVTDHEPSSRKHRALSETVSLY